MTAPGAVRRKTLLLLRNSPVTGQWSMWNSCDYIAQAAAPDFEVRVHTPPAALSRLPIPGRKFLVYFDVYVLGAVGLGLKALGADLVAAVDQAYAPALWLTPRRKRTAFVHDTIAMRQARGLLAGAPPVGASGKLYQAWIRRALAAMRVLAGNTALEADYLRDLGVGGAVVEVGQPAPEQRLGAPTPGAARRPYLLHVGSDNWLKNKAYLIELHSLLVRRLGEQAPDLVLAGRTRKETAERIAILGLAQRIHCVSGPSDADLAGLFAGCRAVISPSRVEGFGVPPLEGLIFGRMPLLADTPVFRHIYGRVARFFPLDDAQAAADIVAEALAESAAPTEPARQALLQRYSFAAVASRTRAWLAASLKASEA